jgi:hypothetical protein
MKIIERVKGIRSILMGAVLTAISLVIAQSWSQAIKITIKKVVNKFRCGRILLIKSSDSYDKYAKCQQEEDIYSIYINAIIVTICLSIIAYILFGRNAVKKLNNNNKII